MLSALVMPFRPLSIDDIILKWRSEISATLPSRLFAEVKDGGIKIVTPHLNDCLRVSDRPGCAALLAERIPEGIDINR